MKDKKFKSLSDYKEEIHRCSKCGICQSACPLFKLTGNECTVSRGQFIMLDGVIKGHLKINNKINKYLDLCLKCNKCSASCPSEIDVVDIILSAKHEYFKHSLVGMIAEIWQSKLMFNTALNTLKLISKIFHRKKTVLYPEKPTATVVYFGGCISVLKPDINDYANEILAKMNYKTFDVDFNCCGMPFYTTGNFDRFVEQIKENLSKIPDDCEYIVTDCASCEWAWNQYKKFIDDEKLSRLKIIDIYSLIEQSGFKFVSDKKCSVTYHKPCHTENDSVLNIIKNIENIDYIEMENYDECCGFGNFEHPRSLKVSKPIRDSKKENIEKAKADIVLTNCVGCLISLNIITGFKQTTKRLIEFLNKHCKIK